MSVATALADGLLAAGVLAELVCVAGLVWMRDVFDRLHFAAAGTTVGPVLVGAAVVLTPPPTVSAAIESVVSLAVLVVANPVLTHAIARAVRQPRGVPR